MERQVHGLVDAVFDYGYTGECSFRDMQRGFAFPTQARIALRLKW
jgi:hypothetical protein